MSIYAKEFLAIYFAFLEYSHILWGTNKPTIVLTDNKSVTRFFQTKMIPPALWNACDYVMQFNFLIAHVPGKMNTAADFLSRLELDPKEKLQLTLRNDIETKPIEVNIQNADITQEEQFFFLDEEEDETEEQIWQRKEERKEQLKKNQAKNSRQPEATPQANAQNKNQETTSQNGTQDNTNKEATQQTSEICQYTRLEVKTVNYDPSNIKPDAKIRVEQDNDKILRNLKLMILKEQYDEQLLKTTIRGQKYCQNIDRIIIKDGLLIRRYFGETGEVKYLQVLLPQQLVKDVLEFQHGKFGKHPGIAKVIQQCREKYYYPGLALRIRQQVASCQECIQNKRIDPKKITPPMIDTNAMALGPEDALQIDVVPFDEPSGGYTAVITAMDAFSRYLFAYNVIRADSKTVARVIIDIMTRHAYLPSCLISDKGSQFISEVTKEVAKVLGIELSHATTKHAQTIGRLERCHASIKNTLKITTGERRTMWHKYVQVAVLNYNTSYHNSLGCEPSRVFHGRIPFNVIDLKFGMRPAIKQKPTTEVANEIQQQTNEILDKTQKYLMQSFVKYKAYYDKRATACQLSTNDYVFVLHPKAASQSTKLPFSEFMWTGPFIIVKRLPNNNYVVRRLMTNKTQTLHRIRLRLYPTDQQLPDINTQQENFQPDKEVQITNDDLYAMAWETDFGTPHFYNEPKINLQTEETIIEEGQQQIQQNAENAMPEQESTENQQENIEIIQQNEEMNARNNNNTQKSDIVRRIPRGARSNLRPNPTSNWKRDYVYYNSIERSPTENETDDDQDKTITYNKTQEKTINC